jgi:hypothetical protein
MSRSLGVQDKQATLGTRIIFWFAKRHLRRIPAGMRIRALDPKLLRASLKMDMYAASERLLSMTIKELVQLKVAMLVGCPF